MLLQIRSLHPFLLAAAWCGLSATSLLAQGPGGPPPGGGPGGHHGPPSGPLFEALDTNHDGVLSADEIANAPASLRALLKNGATQLTRDDLRPVPPAGPAAGDRSAAADENGPRPRPPAPRPHQPPPRPEEQDAPEAPRGAAVLPPERAAQEDAPADRPDHHAHHGPPPGLLFEALDTNHDGVLSADEMKDASSALKGLLKGGSTELRREDLRPGRPPGPRGN